MSILEDEQPWLHNSCLGPVVDVQLVSDVYRTDRLVYRRVRDGLALSEIIGHKAFYIGRDLFYPTVYDSVTVTNCMTRFYTFIAHIPYQESYLLAATHLILILYCYNLDTSIGMKWAEQMGQALGILEEAYSRTESV